MKKIRAIIRTDVLEKVLRVLRAMKNLPGCTVSYVRGYQKSAGTSLDSEPENEEMTKLEPAVKDTDVKRVIDAIAANARTGGPGDGKIFVIDCAGERSRSATPVSWRIAGSNWERSRP